MGSSGLARKVHALPTLTARISRFWSFLKEDLEPRVAASLHPRLEKGIRWGEQGPDQMVANVPSCFLRISDE